jgi:hypothetical protein
MLQKQGRKGVRTLAQVSGDLNAGDHKPQFLAQFPQKPQIEMTKSVVQKGLRTLAMKGTGVFILDMPQILFQVHRTGFWLQRMPGSTCKWLVILEGPKGL